MVYIPSIILMLFSWGCVTNSGTQQNSWVLLDKAEDIECSQWPIPDSDIDTQSLKVIEANGKVGFVSTGRTRTSQSVRYWTKFTGETAIEVSHLKKLEWGSDPEYLGFSTLGQGPLIILEQGSKSRSIEFRNPSTNIIKFSKRLQLALQHTCLLMMAQWLAHKRIWWR